MKSVFILLNILFFISSNFCQEIISDPHHEIFCGSENYNSQLTYNLIQIGTVWDVEWPNITTHIFSIDIDSSSNGGLFMSEPNRPISYWKGYNYIALIPAITTEDFGFGLYKLTVMNKYIYLDWRDTRYGWYSSCNGHCADIWIKYDGNDGNIYVKNDASYSWGNPVPIGKYFSIWELKNQGTPLTDVRDYWQNCLALIPSETGNHPRLVWGPHPTFSAAKYRVYRAVSNNPVNPASLNYSLVHQTVNSSTFEFTDYAVTILPGYQYAYYYIVGWNGSNESAKTNYVSTQAEFQKPMIPELNKEIPEDFALYQNYPNPFNPSTKIYYSIKEEGLVTLKVYDVLGKEIATLVNENKPEGIYEAEFNASQLPSGIYIYSIQAGEFKESKKMLLMK